MTTPSDNLDICNYVAAFVDVLGQERELEQIGRRLPKVDTPEYAELVKKLDRTVVVVRVLQERFQKAFDRFADRAESDDLGELFQRKLKFQRFSDGLVAFHTIAFNHVPCPPVGVHALLATCGGVMLEQLADSAPIRIGIDLHVGFEAVENELYGPVVNAAYKLESRVAKYPRIVVGNGLYEYLKTCADEQGKSPVAQVARSMGVNSLAFIEEDYDGQYIVDYMSVEFPAMRGTDASDKSSILRVLSDIHEFIEQQINTHRLNRDRKLSCYYSLLNDYFEPRYKELQERLSS